MLASGFFGLTQLLGQRWDIPFCAFCIGGTGVDIPKSLSFAVGNVLRAILLWLALIHKPTIIRCGSQPKCGVMTQLCRLKSQLISPPGIVRRITMLKNASSMEIVFGGLHCGGSDQIAYLQSPLTVTLAHGAIFRRAMLGNVGMFMYILIVKLLQCLIHDLYFLRLTVCVTRW